jgi:hypothetical protein
MMNWRETIPIVDRIVQALWDSEDYNTLADVKNASTQDLKTLANLTTAEATAVKYWLNNVRRHLKNEWKSLYDANVLMPYVSNAVDTVVANFISKGVSEESTINLLIEALETRRVEL